MGPRCCPRIGVSPPWGAGLDPECVCVGAQGAPLPGSAWGCVGIGFLGAWSLREAELFPVPGQAAPGAGTARGSRGGAVRGSERGSYEGFYVTASQSPPLPPNPSVGLGVIENVCAYACVPQ